jgi:hypothetical protein
LLDPKEIRVQPVQMANQVPSATLELLAVKDHLDRLVALDSREQLVSQVYVVALVRLELRDKLVSLDRLEHQDNLVQLDQQALQDNLGNLVILEHPVIKGNKVRRELQVSLETLDQLAILGSPDHQVRAI